MARRTPTQARATRTRAALVDAARDEFAASGYAGTTARSIAVRAGAATGSFYQYFDDKDEILREICQQRLEDVGEQARRIFHFEVEPNGDAVGNVNRKRLAQVVQLVMDLHASNPNLHRVITEREHADARLREMTGKTMGDLATNIAEMLRHWGYDGDVQARAFLICMLVEGAVHAHVLGEAVVSDRRFKKDLVAALESLIGPPPTLNSKSN